MSITAYEAVWEYSASKGSQRLIMLSLAEHADETGSCWPSIDRIAKRTNVSRRQVSRALSELVGMGEIAYIPGDGRGNYSKYKILLIGVKDDMVSSNRQAVKDDKYDIKDDMVSQRVTNDAIKDDMVSYRTSIEPSMNLQESPKVDLLPKKQEKPKVKKQTRKTKTAIEDLEVPEALKTPEFSAAWNDFVQHRREIKKPLTPLAAKKQLNQLAAWGVLRAVAAINHSIAKGWQGIFENKDTRVNGKSNSRPQPAPASERVGGFY